MFICDFVMFIFVNCACILHHSLNKKFPLLKILLALHRPLELLLIIKRPLDRKLYGKLIVFLRIVMWHISVNSLAQG